MYTELQRVVIPQSYHVILIYVAKCARRLREEISISDMSPSSEI
jgi:hypothetical protein